jgi:uncharacterized protein YjbI with pentapeptide repeats
MPDTRALAILRHSVEEWNQWRKTHPKPDLSCVSLGSANLAGADLTDCDLSWTNLLDVDLRGADLRRALLGGTDFTGTQLEGVNFSGADFSPRASFRSGGNVYGSNSAGPSAAHGSQQRVKLGERDLRGVQFLKANLQAVEFVDADLRGAVFRGAIVCDADLHWANLEGCDLRDTDLRGANLSYCNLCNADLRGADLEGADLRLAHFHGTNLLGANLANIRFQWLTDASELRDARNLLLARVSADLAAELGFPENHNDNVGKLDFRSYHLEGANLESANFGGASFENTRCASVKFRGAVLVSANLSHSDLRGADLREANLKHADLSGADLRGALLDKAVLDHANLQRARVEDCSGIELTQLAAAANHTLARLDARLLGLLNVPPDHNERIELNDLQGYQLAGADLRGANLNSAILVNCNLAGARLDGARLCQANLEGASLVGASLVKADLTGALLADARLRDADLRDADLRDIQILSTRQLAGTNVSGAKLPDSLKSFEALQSIKESSENSRKIFLSMLALAVYSWLTVAATKDAALLTNTGLLQLPIIQTQIPIGWFYWVTPAMLLGVFLYCHFYLQNLWEELAQLPAYFPDGRPLHQRVYPWMLNSIARMHFARLRSERGLLSVLQYWTTIMLTWWIVPLTEAVFWMRYLPRHEWGGTAIHVILAGCSVAGATIFLRLAASTLEGCADDVRIWPLRESFKGLLACFGPAAAVLIVLGTLSFGAIEGGIGYARVDPRSFVPSFFAAVHFSPAARLSEEDISTKPLNWVTDHPDFDQVKGAHLAYRDLRYAEARNAFLVKADLTGADLRHADLSGADLRHAILTRAHLQGANLTGAKLDGAVLTGCECAGLVLQHP